VAAGAWRRKVGALRRDVDDAGGVDVAVGEAAGTARELDALGVVGVLRHEPRKAVAELADRRDAAKTDLVARAHADGRADRAVSLKMFSAPTANSTAPKKSLSARSLIRSEVNTEIEFGRFASFSFVRVPTSVGRGGVALVVGGIDLEG
jgi:hypothetical protein